MSVTKEKQMKGLKRNTIDKFYTKSQIAHECIQHIQNTITFAYDDCIIEPSAGNGAFIEGINRLSKNVLLYDIEPQAENIIKQDYLQLDVSELTNTENTYHAIGNPPFGRQSSLAIKFIKQSSLFCESISFILPKSFKKESMQRHFPLSFHLIFEVDLANNAFTVDDIEHHVPCIFQIWKKKEMLRDAIPRLQPTLYTFVKKHENPDISVRRVGVNAGEISKDYTSKSVQTHYFLKFSEGVITDDIFKELQNINFISRDNTVGPRSISKQELNLEYMKLVY